MVSSPGLGVKRKLFTIRCSVQDIMAGLVANTIAKKASFKSTLNLTSVYYICFDQITTPSAFPLPLLPHDAGHCDALGVHRAMRNQSLVVRGVCTIPPWFTRMLSRAVIVARLRAVSTFPSLWYAESRQQTTEGMRHFGTFGAHANGRLIPSDGAMQIGNNPTP